MGLFGIWHTDPRAMDRTRASVVSGARERVEIRHWPGFTGGRFAPSILNPEVQPVVSTSGRYSLWLDGDFSNCEAMAESFGAGESTGACAELALTFYQTAGWRFLKECNGLFSIALFDAQTRTLTLANDRYGLRPLYWVQTPFGYAYSSEVETLWKLPGVDAQIDSDAVQEWFSFGYLLGNRTWMKGIEMLPAASILTVSELGATKTTYWSWAGIREDLSRSREDEIAEELGRLWMQAVRRRKSYSRPGVSLSGGLDSRSVLAALQRESVSPATITFGQPGCDDCIIATASARVHATRHYIAEINQANWLAPRIPAVWKTDGMFNILHMHGVEAFPMVRELFDVEIQSFAGDLILGGSYLTSLYVNNWAQSFDLVFSKLWLSSTLVPMIAAKDCLQRHLNPYLALRQSDYFFLDSRVRRFTNPGTMLYAPVADRVFPTYDNDLIDFVYSIAPALAPQGSGLSSDAARSVPRVFRFDSLEQDTLADQRVQMDSRVERQVGLVCGKTRAIHGRKNRPQ